MNEISLEEYERTISSLLRNTRYQNITPSQLRDLLIEEEKFILSIQNSKKSEARTSLLSQRQTITVLLQQHVNELSGTQIRLLGKLAKLNSRFLKLGTLQCKKRKIILVNTFERKNKHPVWSGVRAALAGTIVLLSSLLHPVENKQTHSTRDYEKQNTEQIDAGKGVQQQSKSQFMKQLSQQEAENFILPQYTMKADVHEKRKVDSLLALHPSFTHGGVVGLATHYEGIFHGRKTSNLDYFDVNKVSAAVPMGGINLLRNGILEVTNLENGKKILLVANDSGNFGVHYDANQQRFVGNGRERGTLQINLPQGLASELPPDAKVIEKQTLSNEGDLEQVTIELTRILDLSPAAKLALGAKTKDHNLLVFVRFIGLVQRSA